MLSDSPFYGSSFDEFLIFAHWLEFGERIFAERKFGGEMELSGKHLIQFALVFGLLVFFAANWFVGAYKPRSVEEPKGIHLHNPQYKSQSSGSSMGTSYSPRIDREYAPDERPKRKYPFYGNW